MSEPQWSMRFPTSRGLTRFRTEGEAVLIEQLSAGTLRVLDLGTGDGRLLGLVKLAYPECMGVALDFSPTLLEKARTRFAGDRAVRVVEHDLAQSFPTSESSTQ